MYIIIIKNKRPKSQKKEDIELEPDTSVDLKDISNAN